mgnify:FL=1|tara:strand:+ start:631 stop:1599 length:969 start_codon:yes stop_codon:yes gene_type:complete
MKKKNKYYPKAIAGAAIAAAVAGGSALVKAGVGISQSIRAKRDWKERGEQLTKDSQYKVPNMFKKLADDAVSDDLMERREEQMLSSQAASLGAMKQVDARQAGATMNSLARKAKGERSEMAAFEHEAKNRALESLASQESLAEQSSNVFAQGQIAGIQGAKAAGMQNIMTGIEEIGDVASVAQEQGLFGKKSTPGAPSDFASSLSQEQMDELTAVENQYTINKKGGKIAEDGGVTPDEFDHDTNPIDLVQDGEKIGEATGGELILPPDDVKAIEESLKEGDKEAAFKLMQELVQKYKDNTMEAKAKNGKKVKRNYKPSRLKY